MALRFGQTLFGAAVGVVSAAGLAACMATAQGHMEVRKRTIGETAVATAQVSGISNRILTVPVQPASAVSLAQGNPSVEWKVAGTASGAVTVSGQARAFFYPTAIANVVYSIEATPIRIAKIRPTPAKAYASLEATAQTYNLLYAVPARAFAQGFGTTYHLAYGHGQVTAQATGRLSWKAGLQGNAVAEAAGEGAVAYTRNFYTDWCEGTAELLGSFSYTRNGVRYSDLSGTAAFSVEVRNTHVAIYPSATANVTASASGRISYRAGAKGHANGVASARINMIAASTAVTLVSGEANSFGEGRLRAHFKAKAQGTVTASGQGQAVSSQTRVAGLAQVSATASGEVKLRTIKFFPDIAFGQGSAQAGINRIQEMSGSPVTGYVSASGSAQRIQVAYGVAKGTSDVLPKAFRILLAKGAASASAAASLQRVVLQLYPPAAEVTATTESSPIRDAFIRGEAHAQMSAPGSVQVNDAIQAPGSRTYVIGTESRVIPVLLESRTVIV